MTGERIVYVAGATAPALDVDLTRRRRPAELDATTVASAIVVRPGLATLAAHAADVIDTGEENVRPARVRVTWAAGDLDVPPGATDPAEFEVTLRLTSPAGVEFTGDPVRFLVKPLPA